MAKKMQFFYLICTGLYIGILLLNGTANGEFIFKGDSDTCFWKQDQCTKRRDCSLLIDEEAQAQCNKGDALTVLKGRAHVACFNGCLIAQKKGACDTSKPCESPPRP